MHEIIINYLSMIHCLKLNWLTSVINGVLIGPCTLTLCPVTLTRQQMINLFVCIATTFQFLCKNGFQTDRETAGTQLQSAVFRLV